MGSINGGRCQQYLLLQPIYNGDRPRSWDFSSGLNMCACRLQTLLVLCGIIFFNQCHKVGKSRMHPCQAAAWPLPQLTSTYNPRSTKENVTGVNLTRAQLLLFRPCALPTTPGPMFGLFVVGPCKLSIRCHALFCE